jgi:hypothetical protein
MTSQTSAFVELSRHLLLGSGPFETLKIPFHWAYIRFIAEQHGDRDAVYSAALDTVRLWAEHGSQRRQDGTPTMQLLESTYREQFKQAMRDWGGPFDQKGLPTMRMVFEAAIAEQGILRSRKKGSEQIILYLNNDKRKDEFFAEVLFPRSDPTEITVFLWTLSLKQQVWHPGGLMGSPPPACMLWANPAARRPAVIADALIFLIRVMQAYRPIIDLP